jgi:hypothetical protein
VPKRGSAIANPEAFTDTQATATYGATVTTKLYNWITAGIVAFVLVLVGFIIVVGMFTGEYWCADRHPWWGPPESGTDAECGFLYEQRYLRLP